MVARRGYEWRGGAASLTWRRNWLATTVLMETIAAPRVVRISRQRGCARNQKGSSDGDALESRSHPARSALLAAHQRAGPRHRRQRRQAALSPRRDRGRARQEVQCAL